MILRKHQNDLYKIALSVGVDMSKLEASLKDDNSIIINFTSDARLFFRVREYKLHEYDIMSVPNVAHQEANELYTIDNFEWPRILELYKEWCNVIKEETDEPNLWEEVERNANTFSPFERASDEKFDNHEIRELQAQIRLLTTQINQSALPLPAKAALLEIAVSAPEKAERFTKKEWQGWFLGAVVTQITNLALSPEHVASIYQMLKTTFSALLLH
jgi:hypothetical protein